MKNPIKRKLRIRFVLLAMTALLILQGIIVSVSIYNSYNDLVEKSDTIIEQLRHNPSSNVRYFSVKVDLTGSHIRPETVQYVSLTKEDILTFTKEALQSGTDKGFVSDYRYHIYSSEKGARILFLSRSSSLEMFRTDAINLLQISAAGLCVMCIALILVSGWVVQPLIRNHEKQKQFITAASHELKTPLTVISTDAQLLRSEIGENHWIDGILQQVDHLTRMTQDLVTLAKAEEYSSPVVREYFSLSSAFTAVLDTYSGLSDTGKISLTRTVPADISYCGNQKELHQLLCVLLDNAFKYCPQGGHIAVSLKQDKRSTRLAVSNTTAAVPDLSGLTQRFCRGQNAAGTSGFGLGLSIAQAIVRRHKGNLTVKLPNENTFLVEVELR